MELDSIPGLKEAVFNIRSSGLGSTQDMARNNILAGKLIASAKADPVSFVRNNFSESVQQYTYLSALGSAEANEKLKVAKNQSDFLKNNNVSSQEIQGLYQTGLDKGKQEIQTYQKSQESGDVGGFLDAALPIALAFALPGAGAVLGAEIFATQIAAGTMTAATATAIGTAIASTAVQTSQGVDFETALTNATVNAVVSTQSPTIANDIAKKVSSPGVADAITSGGASIVSTLAKGGSAKDALRNAGAAIAASGATQIAQNFPVEGGDKLSQPTSRAIGAAVGGGITGGATGAAIGAVGELGRPPATSGDRQVASAGDVNKEFGVVSDSPELDVEITGLRPRETTIADTNTQIIDTIRNQQPTTPPATRTEAPVEITAPRIPQIEITAPREPAKIEDTDIQTVDVVGKREEEPVISEETAPEKEAPKKGTGLYEPNLFIYSGKSPRARGNKALTQALGTDFAGGTPTPTTGLTTGRGAGEIEGEGGIKRKNVWNEESLRLKDALGI